MRLLTVALRAGWDPEEVTAPLLHTPVSSTGEQQRAWPLATQPGQQPGVAWEAGQVPSQQLAHSPAPLLLPAFASSAQSPPCAQQAAQPEPPLLPGISRALRGGLFIDKPTLTPLQAAAGTAQAQTCPASFS